MKKSELLKYLDDAVKTEELATTIFFQHLKAISMRFNLESEFVKRFQTVTDFLITENKRHKKECEILIKKVKGMDKNDI